MYRTGEIYDDIKKTIIDIYIDYGISGFPVDETSVCRKMRVALIPYTNYGKEDRKLLLKKSQHGFYVPGTADNSPTIFYNDLYESKGAQRLTVFHELKHYVYSDMNYWRQLESVAHSRWVGAFWQDQGQIVIPTISWSDRKSFEFCFDGVEKHSIVAIGMIGCKHSKNEFMYGYNEMLNHIEPDAIICFGDPFKEMEGYIIPVDYRKSRKVVR